MEPRCTSKGKRVIGLTRVIAKYASQTPTGRLATMAEIVDAVVFLLENRVVNGVDLIVDGGWHCR